MQWSPLPTAAVTGEGTTGVGVARDVAGVEAARIDENDGEDSRLAAQR